MRPLGSPSLGAGDNSSYRDAHIHTPSHQPIHTHGARPAKDLIRSRGKSNQHELLVSVGVHAGTKDIEVP